MSKENLRLVVMLVALFFLFSGDPDVFDKLRGLIMNMETT